MVMRSRIVEWGGLLFALGNVLFVTNKVNEMSRLFLGRPMQDVISGNNIALVLLGQVALVIGYIVYYQFYAQRVKRLGKYALRLFTVGGILVAIGHASFLSFSLPLRSYTEYLFALVLIGMLLLIIGLIWFGVLTFRQPIMRRGRWLPFATGLMGFIGFFLFAGEEITAIFLFFRTLFALGLVGLGLILWQERPILAKAI